MYSISQCLGYNRIQSKIIWQLRKGKHNLYSRERFINKYKPKNAQIGQLEGTFPPFEEKLRLTGLRISANFKKNTENHH